MERFPVGKRIAFDAAQGRLWVVCRGCERWNLVPLDERWETVEELEEMYSSLTVRYSTEHIGLARHPGGADLVRVGRPKRPEFAAWRYGDQFGRRRRRRWLGGGALAATFAGGAAAALTSAGVAAVLGPAVLITGYTIMPLFTLGGFGPTVVRLSDGRYKGLFRSKARNCFMVPSDVAPGWAIRVPERKLKTDGTWAPATVVEFQGEDARIVATRLIPAANPWGAGTRVVGDAVHLLDRTGGPSATVTHLISGSPRLGSLARPQRLALEMALHEEDERRALEGELQDLEAQWRAAEELASISDALLVPEEVERRLQEMKRAPHPPRGDGP